MTHPSARAVLEIHHRGSYAAPGGATVSVADALRTAVAGTRAYAPEQIAALAALDPADGPSPQLQVTDESTQIAAERLSRAGATDLAVLNFASARNPGGGFLNGARAQEEDLCRCSGLFACLSGPAAAPYYAANREQSSLLYTDWMIHSPGVPWFRTAGGGPLLDAPFHTAVITAPAPNAGPLLQREPDAHPAIRATFVRRWIHVLALAVAHDHRHLVLGAWGCGAFRNDPETAARTAEEALADPRFAGRFDQVVFAIPRLGRQGVRNHDVFCDVLRGERRQEP